MSRSKLFNMIKSRGEQPNGRNDFDLSNWHGYTQNFATIQPLKAVFTIPDDYMDVDVSDMAQNISPMNTAAPLSASRELSAYFVPHNFIWHNYNQYQATREDPDSSAMQIKGISFEPRFATYDLYYQAFFFFSEYIKCLCCTRAYNYWSYKRNPLPENSFLIDMNYISSQFGKLLYEYYETNRTSNDYLFTSDEILSHRLYNGADSDLNFKGHYYGIEGEVYPGKVTNAAVFFDVVGQWKWCDVIRKLDMFGYGNIYPIFYRYQTMCLKVYDDFISMIDENIDVWDDDTDFNTNYNTYCLSEIKNILQDLVKHLKCICTRLDSTADYITLAYNTQVPISQVKRVKVFPLFAYNHIFYNMFRNTYRDLQYNVRNYNCDFLNCTTDLTSTIQIASLPERFLNLECHQWKKDMFTSLLPDMQIGAVQNVSILTSFDSNRWLQKSGDILPNSVSVQSSNVGNLKVNSIGIIHDHTAAFDVLALKRAEALQQYYMDLMRAGNRTEDIFKQVYGKAPKSEEHKTPYFVDAVTSPLSVNPILATADTGERENGSLGDIAARALVQSKPLNFKFSTSDFGCLIFLSFMSVDSAYNSYRIDPHLMNLTPEANFIPQLMNLGYEWLTRESLSNLVLGIKQDQPLGCSPRYIEFKTDIDLVHGNLVDSINDVNTAGSTLFQKDIYEGSMDIWAVTRTDMQQEEEVSLRNFYQDPRVVNNVFKVQKSQFDPSFETDQFICFSNVKIKAIRQLSELGLPRFV